MQKDIPLKKFLETLSLVLPAKTAVGLHLEMVRITKKCIRMLRHVRKPCPHAAPRRIQT